MVDFVFDEDFPELFLVSGDGASFVDESIVCFPQIGEAVGFLDEAVVVVLVEELVELLALEKVAEHDDSVVLDGHEKGEEEQQLLEGQAGAERLLDGAVLRPDVLAEEADLR